MNNKEFYKECFKKHFKEEGSLAVFLIKCEEDVQKYAHTKLNYKGEFGHGWRYDTKKNFRKELARLWKLRTGRFDLFKTR